MNLLSLFATKSSAALLKMVGRGGSLPGTIGLKLDPNILQQLKFSGPVILVTGTNGKTSTANLIASAFEQSGKKVVSNRKGDNLKAGIATVLLENASMNGMVNADAVVLEVDELNIRHVLPYIPVSALVVTNFFRDQLDRAREMEQLIASIEKVLPEFKGTLVLNGNDPNTVRLASKAPLAQAMYFGLKENQWALPTTSEASEGKFCPSCGSRLEYDYYQYSHIGRFHCPSCDFATPDLDVELEVVSLDDNTFKWKDIQFAGPYSGMYSMYNYAAMLAAVKQFKLPVSSVQEVFRHAPVPFGRNEKFMKGDQEIILNLIKNPTGANEVMKVIERDPRNKSALIVLNDAEQDGRDISWIYDTHFEVLINDQTSHIACSGSRAYDMALRLHYGGWDQDIYVDPSLEQALSASLKDTQVLYVIATYTALYPSRAAIVKEIKK